MDTARRLGERVRRLRENRGWTLDEASSRLAISRRSLVQIEQGDSNPSLSTLLAVAAGFGVQLSELLEGPSDCDLFVGPATPRRLWSTESGSKADLAAAYGPLELWRWELQPGDSRSSDAHAHGSRECIHVHSGRLNIEIGDQTAVVGPGEAVSFDSERAHRYVNNGRYRAVFSLAVYDPIAG